MFTGFESFSPYESREKKEKKEKLKIEGPIDALALGKASFEKMAELIPLPFTTLGGTILGEVFLGSEWFEEGDRKRFERRKAEYKKHSFWELQVFMIKEFIKQKIKEKMGEKSPSGQELEKIAEEQLKEIGIVEEPEKE
jgi:hypothetical protein